MPAELTAVRFSENLPTVWAILPTLRARSVAFFIGKTGIEKEKEKVK